MLLTYNLLSSQPRAKFGPPRSFDCKKIWSVTLWQREANFGNKFLPNTAICNSNDNGISNSPS